MFPNPQDALPLPRQPNLERYKKIAKDLANVCRLKDPGALSAWAKEWVQDLVRLSDLAITADMPVAVRSWSERVEEFAKRKLLASDSDTNNCRVSQAQFVIARSHGFASWPKFVRHISAVSQNVSSVSRFEAAADAIVQGEVDSLKRLLEAEPELVRLRSNREHNATLLHYVSANGVEGYRQRTPSNIVQIAEILLRAGAEVDATANVYGGSTTLGLAATSVHPERAGVQEALLQILLDYGATMDPPNADGLSLIGVCLANGRYRAAAFLASRGARIDLPSAAGLGRFEAVEQFFSETGRISRLELEQAFFFACEYGDRRVVEFLVEHGVDLAAQSRDGQTGLHWAVVGGHLEIVELLLRYEAPLDIKNQYGGTVLGQAMWSAEQRGADAERYRGIIERLEGAGGKV